MTFDAPASSVTAPGSPGAITVTVRYFASIREAVGRGAEALATRAATPGALRDELIARGGPWAEALARGRAVRVALDQVLCGEDAALAEGAEVAFFPPVTGG
ncbi:MoaD/ThiS family protein [Paracidovorax anthurii]|uniref:Molybdopterin synthase sulfur carrier subunit n=1 Tax=Paracidovorax anthurii TaxID=78229 RepID=A0A328ZB29_9BURK|nr:MoaD/ThiS family protein [Paracidovorax anthurii]RAR81832.1 molybdopterin synthase subunit MoaD [Paracidovorax anthurii]